MSGGLDSYSEGSGSKATTTGNDGEEEHDALDSNLAERSDTDKTPSRTPPPGVSDSGASAESEEAPGMAGDGDWGEV